jgi:Na+-driven multidrug efflux pump
MLSQKNRAGVSKVIQRIVVISLGVGGLNAMLAGLIPYLVPHFFTTSPAIALQMQDLSQLLSGSLVAHACTMALEGVLLAERELTYLAGCYAVNTALILVALAMLGGRAIAISNVWVTLLAFQAIRLVQFGAKLAFKHRLLGKGWTWFKGLMSRVRRRGGDLNGGELQVAKA